MRLSSISIMRWVILIAAILVWVNVYAFITRAQTVAAPLLIENLEPSLAIAEPITTVQATVSGGLRDIANLSDQNLQFAIDASSISAVGSYTLEIYPKSIPSHIKVASFAPHTISVTIEPIASKLVDVIAVSRGIPSDKHSVRAVTAAPSQVTIFGAASLLASVSEARAYIDVTRHQSSFTAPSSVVVVNGENRIIQSLRASPTSVKVTVEIVEGAAVRNLGLLPVFSGELPGGFWVQEVVFDPPVVQVRGSQKILESLISLNSTPINLVNRRTSFNDQVAVNLPDGVDLVGENLVMARIILGSTAGTRQFDIAPQYVNVTEGFGVTTITPASIQVVISGDPQTINQLKRSDIKLNLDLTGSLSGSNQITITPAMFSLPPNFQVVSYTPAQVEVVLTRS